MNEIEEYLFHYQKLIDLLVEDSQNVAKALQGDLLEAYRGLLIEEQRSLETNLSILKRQL